MTDDQAARVLEALADVPYAWARPGVRFQVRAVDPRPGPPSGFAPFAKSGVVVGRDGDRLDVSWDSELLNPSSLDLASYAAVSHRDVPHYVLEALP